MSHIPILRRATVVPAVIAAGALSIVAIAAPAHADSRHRVGTDPGWTSHARTLGQASSSEQVDFGLLLKMRNQSAAVAQLQSISDPSSANYGSWLSNQQFDASYAPAASDVSAVRQWLSGQGFTVRNTFQSGMYVQASGSVAQIEKTFGTTVDNYSYKGQTVRSNTTALSLSGSTPSAVVNAVDGVVGVDQGATLKTPADTVPPPSTGFRAGQPCSQGYYGQKTATAQPAVNGVNPPYVVCGYGPSQYQSAYGLTSAINRGQDGRGVTVAITDAYTSPTLLQDAQKYNAYSRQPAFRPGQFSEISNPVDDGGACGDWYGEQMLDVEAVHAMAPGAKIVYVGAADCGSGLDDAWASTIDNHVADIITNSWSDDVDDVADLGGQSYVDFYNQFALEAALTGITVNFSSGDSGDYTDGGTDLAAKTVGFPSDVPWVSGIGGTSVGINRNGQKIWEYGWQTDYSPLTNGAWGTPAYSSGGGGGTSELFTQPFYQRGQVPTSISEANGSTPMRAVPDIAMPGDPNTGFLVGQTQSFPNGVYWDVYRIGGTSLSSPLMAGVLADLDSAIHHSIGFANPLYYALSHTPAINDISAPKSPVLQVRTNYVNSVDASGGLTYLLQTVDVQNTTLHDTPGYDDETGVGTPNFGVLLRLIPAFHGRR